MIALVMTAAEVGVVHVVRSVMIAVARVKSADRADLQSDVQARRVIAMIVEHVHRPIDVQDHHVIAGIGPHGLRSVIAIIAFHDRLPIVAQVRREIVMIVRHVHLLIGDPDRRAIATIAHPNHLTVEGTTANRKATALLNHGVARAVTSARSAKEIRSHADPSARASAAIASVCRTRTTMA